MCQVPSLLDLAPWPNACYIWFVAPLARCSIVSWACVAVCDVDGLLDLPWLKIATNKNHANLKPRKWLGSGKRCCQQFGQNVFIQLRM